MKHFLVLLAFLTALPTGGALGLSLDEIIDNGRIRIAVYADFPPYSHGDRFKPRGIDVDIAGEIAKRLGVELDIMTLTADENVEDDLRNAVWKGHYLGGGVADVMLHVPYDRAFAVRNDLVVLFGAYYDESLVVARDREKLGEGSTIANFVYDKIAVETDTIEDFFLLGAFGGAIRNNVVHFTTTEQAVAALKAGEVAGAMGTRGRVEAALGADAGRFDVDMLPYPGLAKPTWLVGAAVKHTYRALGYAVGDILSEMVRDGSMKRIFETHGVTYRAPPMSLVGGGE